MPRAIVLGNGNLLINLDENLNMRDLFYPVVGLGNHIGGQRCSTGFWEEGTFSWLWEDSWQKKLAYQQDSLVLLFRPAVNKWVWNWCSVMGSIIFIIFLSER